MPRKSKALRLQQAQELLAAYEVANLVHDHRARFARDMICRLQRGKGLSKRQREWLDSLIEEGVPQPKGDLTLLAEIESAQNVEGMPSRDVEILGEFAHKVRRGWSLSEKQERWMLGILAKAQQIREEGPWAPTADQQVKLEACVKLAKGYSHVHWSNNPGTFKAVQAADWYLTHGGTIEEWHVNKLLKAMAGKLRELFETPYVTPDKPCYALEGSEYDSTTRSWGLATPMGPPIVSETGSIVYPVLLGSGTLAYLSRHRLAKRKPR